MSDSAFKTALFPGMTTSEIQIALDEAQKEDTENFNPIRIEKLSAELSRRQRAASGDTSVMTDGERLRYLRTGKAR